MYIVVHDLCLKFSDRVEIVPAYTSTSIVPQPVKQHLALQDPRQSQEPPQEHLSSTSHGDDDEDEDDADDGNDTTCVNAALSYNTLSVCFLLPIQNLLYHTQTRARKSTYTCRILTEPPTCQTHVYVHIRSSDPRHPECLAKQSDTSIDVSMG